MVKDAKKEEKKYFAFVNRRKEKNLFLMWFSTEFYARKMWCGGEIGELETSKMQSRLVIIERFSMGFLDVSK